MHLGIEGRRSIWRKEAENADDYHLSVGHRVTFRETEIILDLIRNVSGPVLDFPCGTGRLTNPLSKAGYEVIAADLLPDMAAFTRKSGNRSVVQADVFHPPFRRGAFGAVLAVRIFFHYPDQDALMSALTDLLAPGGRLVFDTLNALSTRRLAAPVFNLMRRDPQRRVIFNRPARVMDLARRLGLRLKSRRGLHLLPTRLYRYLPAGLYPFLEAVESGLTPAARVLTFWSFEKPASG